METSTPEQEQHPRPRGALLGIVLAALSIAFALGIVVYQSVLPLAPGPSEPGGRAKTEALPPGIGRSYAIVIGIDKYEFNEKWPTLRYARRDAEAIARFARRQGFGDVIELYDGRATKTALIRVMQNEVAPRLEAHDRVLFFFAGHGFTEELGGQDRGYLVPYEGSGLSADLLSMQDLLAQSSNMAKAKHQCFIIDACYGGLLGTRGVQPLDTNLPNYVRVLTERPARQYLTAGGKDERVLDGGEEGHSYFTACLLEALEQGLADLNGDGYVMFSELDSYIKPRASNWNQTPASGTLPGHGQGEFVFFVPRHRVSKHVVAP